MANRRRIDRAERARRARELAGRLGRFALRLIGLAAAVALVCGAAWGGWRFFTASPTFAIRTISIEGAVRATEAEIRSLAGIAEGENLFRADLGGARERLLRHPWIRDVSIARDFPQGIEIRVVERRPLALVDLEHLYLLDEEGEVFKRALPGDPIDLPVITGLRRGEWETRPDEARQRIDEGLRALAAWEERDRSRALPVAEVHLDEAEGVTLYLGENGPAAKLGHGDFERKLDRLLLVLAEVERRGARLELVRLDNRARPGWIAARLAGDVGSRRQTATR